MKKIYQFAIVAVAAITLAACGGKGGAQAAEGAAEAAEQETAVPEGYKTHEFAHFTISLPEEFTTSGEQDYGVSTSVRFDSEATLMLDGDEETLSSATIDCGFMSDGAKPSQIKETAQNLKLGQEAAGETCDEPVIDGNIILMRHYHDNGDGQKGITWQWWIVSESGNNISGNIFYPESQAKYYDGMAQKIVKTIKFK